MLKFNHFVYLLEAKKKSNAVSDTIGNRKTERHMRQYFSPENMSSDYEMASDHGDIKADSKIRFSSIEPVADAKTGKQVMHGIGVYGGKNVQVPLSKVKKKGGRSKQSGNEKFSDEYATQKLWKHISANPMLVSSPEKIKAEIEEAKKDRNHPLHFHNQTNEGFSGGTRTAAHEASYYKELSDSAHTIHALANHPSIQNTFKNGSHIEVMGAARGSLSDTWKNNNARNATSKADIHITDSKTGEVHRVSLKKGKSQLMSAETNEFSATLHHAISQYAKTNKEFTSAQQESVRKKVNQISEHMNAAKGLSKEDQRPSQMKAQSLMDDIHNEHPDLLNHASYEAASGEGKFGGKHSEGSARYVVTTTETGAHVKDLVHDLHTDGPIKVKPIRIATSKEDGRPLNAKIEYAEPQAKTTQKKAEDFKQAKSKVIESANIIVRKHNFFLVDYITEEKLRVGIKHVADLKHEEVGNLLKDDHLHGDFSEKSDGMAFEYGVDKHGFYTRTSHSDKMRHPEDYEAAARAKFGDSFDPSISQHFGRIHNALQSNGALLDHLHATRGEKESNAVKGEVYYRPNGRPAEGHPGHVRFVGTAYDTKKMGNLGTFVVHSRLPENASHDIAKLKSLGDHNFNIDDDVPSGSQNAKVDVSDIRKEYGKISEKLIASRKVSDKSAKAEEQKKLDVVKTKLDQRLRAHTHVLENKWGNETEGHIFHPHNGSQTRVKLISPTFKTNKAAFSFSERK